MAFFGITNFGCQNTFADACSKEAKVYIFNDTDFRDSWMVITKGIKQTANKSQVDAVLTHLYKGTLPIVDQTLINDGFNEILGNEDSSSITYIQFLSTMKLLQVENEELIRTKEDRSRKCAEPSQSNHSYCNKVKAHLQTDHKAKQQKHLTSSQEIGWETTEYKAPVAGKQGSEITKFAAELVKNGIYY
jgi:FtsZ-binding cell division protein ZapB